MKAVVSRGVVLAVCLVAPHPALAQAARPGPFARVTFSTAEVSERNLFAAPATLAEGDLIWRAAPIVTAGYQARSAAWTARYGMSADRYLDHPELNRLFARQEGGTDIAWQAARRISFSGTAAYVATQSPAELNTASLLTVGRARASRLSAGAALVNQRSALTFLTLSLDGTRDLFAATTAATRRARVAVDTRGGRRNDYRLAYSVQVVAFSGPSAASREVSHAITGGFTHALTRRTSLSVDAGPRFGAGVRPEWSLAVRRTSRPGDFSVTYSRTLATAIGSAGTLDVREFLAGGALRPTRQLTLSASAAVARSVQAGRDASVRTVEVAGTVQATRSLSIVGSARIGRQLDARAAVPTPIPMRTLSIGLTIGRQNRPPRDAAPGRAPR